MYDALESEVRADFERAHNRAVFHNLRAVLTRRPTDLPRLDEARRGLAAKGEIYRGPRTVPVERIVGTADRPHDLDRAFRPRRAAAARWQRVARAHYEGRELPPVRLYQVGDEFFVSDGHHRVSVARALGRAFLEAEVVEIRACPAHPADGRPPARFAPRAWRPRLGRGGLRTALPFAPHPACGRGCAA